MENRDLFVECKAASLRVCDTAVSAEDQVCRCVCRRRSRYMSQGVLFSVS